LANTQTKSNRGNNNENNKNKKQKTVRVRLYNISQGHTLNRQSVKTTKGISEIIPEGSFRAGLPLGKG